MCPQRPCSLGAGIAAFTSASVLALISFSYLRAPNSPRAVALGTLMLFIGLALAGAFVGTRPSFEIGTLFIKLSVCVVLLAFTVPVSLDRSERHVFLARLGTVFGNG